MSHILELPLDDEAQVHSNLGCLLRGAAGGAVVAEQFQFKPEIHGLPDIYRVLAGYQVTADWTHRELVVVLQQWAYRFIDTFELKIPMPPLSIDWLRAHVLGHFRPGHNGFGLEGEVAINARHLPQREPWQVLGTLLHELLHAWQQEHGKPGKPPYHNKQFREKAHGLGLLVDERGRTVYAAASPFQDLLARYGVAMPAYAAPSVRPRGSSKLKLVSVGKLPSLPNRKPNVGDFVDR